LESKDRIEIWRKIGLSLKIGKKMILDVGLNKDEELKLYKKKCINQA
jgi:hypothetical protein